MKQQTEIKTLKEGKFVIIDDEPCTIVSVQHSKPGKHGAAKARVDAIGLFDGQKRSIVNPVDAKIYVPIVERKNAQVLSDLGRRGPAHGLGRLLDFRAQDTRGAEGQGQAGRRDLLHFQHGQDEDPDEDLSSNIFFLVI